MLAKNDKETEFIRECYRYLRSEGLVDSKALGTVSITHDGIKEVEKAIIEPGQSTSHFAARISDMTLVSEQIRNPVNEIQNKRHVFLNKAYQLSEGSDMRIVSAFEITEELGYDQRTLERVHFYLEVEGLIKTFAVGGKFTITHRAIKQLDEP